MVPIRRKPSSAVSLLTALVLVLLLFAVPAALLPGCACYADEGVSIGVFFPTRGHAYSSLGIEGEGFTGATSVTVGGKEVDVFTVTDDNNITALVPEGAVTGLVSVTAPEGEAVSSSGFTVLQECDPTLDFDERDELPQSDVPEEEWYLPENWNGGWGPWPYDYPDVEAPGGCSPDRWKRSRIVAGAMKYIGVLPYRHHHIPAWDPPSDPGIGLDCSNFSSWVYNYGLGIKFTSNVTEQAEGGDAPGVEVPPGEEYLPGDLLYITNSEGTSIAHVAIYIDEGHVIDSTSGEESVGIRDFSGWYETRLHHARRVITREPEPSVEASVAEGVGNLNPSSQTVEYGTDATPIAVSPGDGYEIAGIVDNGFSQPVPEASGMYYEIPAVMEDHSVEVFFEYSTPSISSITPREAMNDGLVNISALAGTGFREGAAVKLVGAGRPGVDATNVNVVSSTRITCSFNLEGVAVGPYDLHVENPDGKCATRKEAFTVTEAPVVGSTWYLPEGSTDWGYSCYITVENPNLEELTADVTYNTDNGEVSGGTITLPASSQTTVNPANTLGEEDFSTLVECREGNRIAVDRTMSWTPRGSGTPAGVSCAAPAHGRYAASETEGDAHCSVGVTAPDITWYLPEGSSDWGFECWHLIQNPNDRAANVTFTYMIEGTGPQVRTKSVPPHSRATYNMEEEIGRRDASLRVESDIPVIPERAMYGDYRRMGHDSIGTTRPAEEYFLAEGTTGWGFTTYVLVQNPNGTETSVDVTYMTSSGPVEHPENPIVMPANSRKTIRVNDYLLDRDFSTKITGSQEIIAERAMYWGKGAAEGEACHDSIGMDSPHRVFYLPDGQTSDECETWTLVANPNDEDVTVRLTYLTEEGTANRSFSDTVPASSRKSYFLADAGIDGRAAIMVECASSGKKIMVERAMYWNSRGAGTDTIGGFSD